MRVAARVCVRRWVGAPGTALLPEALWARLAPAAHDGTEALVVLVRTASGARVVAATRGRWEAGAGVGMDGDAERLEEDAIYVPPASGLADGAPAALRAVRAAAVALDRIVVAGELRAGRAALRGVVERGAPACGQAACVVLDTAPLLCGAVAPHTAVCLVPPHALALPPASPRDAPPSPAPSPPPSPAPASSAPAPSPTASPSPAAVSSPSRAAPLLLSSFVRPAAPPPAPPPLALRPLAAPAASLTPAPAARDELLEALVSPAQLRALHLFSGSWVRVAPPPPLAHLALPAPDAPPPPLAALRLYADRSLSADGLHVPPSVAARLASPSVHVALLAASDAALPAALPLATRVVIARLRTPASSGHASYAAPLRALFARARPVAAGELLAVRHRGAPLFFRVTRIEPPAPLALLDPARSALVAEGALNAPLPPGLLPFLAPPPRSLPAPLYARGALPAALDALLAPAASPLAPPLALRPSALIVAPRGSGVRAAVRAACERQGLHMHEASCLALAPPPGAPSAAPAASALRRVFAVAAESAPCVLLLRHAAALDAVALRAAQAASPAPSAVLAVVESTDGLPPALRALFLHELPVAPPDEPERLAALQQLTARLPLARDASLADVAAQSASLVLRDLRALVAHAAHAALRGFVGRAAGGVLCADDDDADDATRDLFAATRPCVTGAHLGAALAAVQATHQGAVARIPRVTWADVGGLGAAKAELLDTVQLPLRMPHLFAAGLRKRSGVLLYGPPGTGKTLLAKAVATECALNFMSVKGPELINMYVGESERNVREVFRKARAARPCVVFFDELDSLAPNRGRGADSGGVADRVVSQLLTELDGLAKAAATDVFVIGATNRPELLDPALLVPGRFDRLVYLGVPAEPATRLSVLAALTRKFRLGPGVDLAALAGRCPATFTGADCYALCAQALVQALKRRVAALEARLVLAAASGDEAAAERRRLLAAEGSVEVCAEDFEAALASVRPSLSRDELARYDALHAKHRLTTGTKP